MELTIRYDELKVRYTDDDICILRTYSGEEIYLPKQVIVSLNSSTWLPLNTGEKDRKLTWKDYLVDELDKEKNGWVIYYPTNYRKKGFYYKIRADLYYEGLEGCPAISVSNDMADEFYKGLTKKSEYKSKVFYNKAPNDRLTNIALPTKISGDVFNITPITIWLKTGAFVESHSVEKWLEEFVDFTKHMAVLLECIIENHLCFIPMKHIKIKS